MPATLSLRGAGELALRPGRTPPRKFDEVLVTRQIEGFRKGRVDNPPSLEEVAKETGFASRTLRQHFPSLSLEISAAHREWFREQAAIRREERRRLFRAAIDACRASQTNPTVRGAKSRLTKPGIMRSATARKEFEQMLIETLRGADPECSHPEIPNRLPDK